MPKVISSTIQQNGQITLPAPLRRKFRLKQGDEVTIHETPHGLLVRPQTTNLLGYLQEMGAQLRAAGIDEEDFRASGEEIRAQLAKDMYGLTEDGAAVSG